MTDYEYRKMLIDQRKKQEVIGMIYFTSRSQKEERIFGIQEGLPPKISTARGSSQRAFQVDVQGSSEVDNSLCPQ